MLPGNRRFTDHSELLKEFVREAIQLKPAVLRESVIIEDFERNVDALISEGILDVIKSAYHGAKGALSRGAVNALRKVNDVFIDLIRSAITAARNSASSGIKFYVSIVDKISAFREAHPLLFKVVMITLTIVLVFAAISLFDSGTAHASLSRGGVNVDEKMYLEVRGMLLQHMDKIGSSDIDKKLEIGKVISDIDAAFKGKEAIQVEKLSGSTGAIASKAFRLIDGLIKESQSSDSNVSSVAVELLKQFYQVAKSTTLSVIK